MSFHKEEKEESGKIIYKKENLQEREIIKSRFTGKRNSEGETNGYGNTGKDPECGN